jgi:membrane fusion protein (multidrug efflux system)
MSNIASLFESREEQQHSAAAEEAAGTPPKSNRKRLFVGFGLALAAAGGSFYAYDTLIASNYVSTENAYVGADVAQVTPLVGGPVREVLVDDTKHVKRGDVLVRLDDTDAKITVARTVAQLAAAQADLEKAQTDLGRRAALAKSGSVSGDEITVARNAMSIAGANLRVAQAADEQARIDLERTVIRAPIDGVVSRRQVQVGQRVQPGATLMAVVPIQEAFVDANFKEGELTRVRPGQKAELVSDLYGHDVVYSGRVVGFSGGTGAAFAVVPAQNATGNWIKVVQRVPVRIELDPTELAKHPLRVGLSMHATINVSEH